MSSENTEKRLKKIICDHYLSGAISRLTIGEVSARAGISRQAFHKSYRYLKPYLTGAKNVDDLLIDDQVETSKTILLCQKLVREAKAELRLLQDRHEKEFQNLEDSLVTTLMSGDVLIHHSREITNELKKKAVHNEILKRQLLEREVELSERRLLVTSAKLEGNIAPSIVSLQADVLQAVSKFSESQDVSAYYLEKAQVISKLKEKVQKILKKGNVRVVLFQNRYISSFRKFVDIGFSDSNCSLVVVELPLAARSEIRDFIRGLVGAKPLEMYVPYCDSEATIKAQRGFSYGHIPAFEFRSFDKEPLPTIQDGFDRVVVHRIAQGD